MPTNKLILTQQTSISDVTDFFKVQDPTKKVRARDLGDGRTELYVRKDSFKQFFTDKLRPDFLVKRDYLKAKDHILDIIKKSDPAGEKSSAFAGVKRGLEGHRHDFYLDEFSNHLDGALYRPEELSLAKEILQLDGSLPNSLSDIGQTVNSEEVQQEILTVLDAIQDSGDKAIFKRNFDALRDVMRKPGPGRQAKLSVIDYNCAIDFCRVWLKEIKNINSGRENLEGSKPTVKITQALTAFAENVVRKGVPERIDLNGGKFEMSDADLIIFDDSVGFAHFSHYFRDTDERETVRFGEYNNVIIITSYPETRVSSEKDSTASFKVSYLPDQQINQEFMNLLYEKIESAFKNKMPQNPTSSPKLMTEGNRADQPYTIHLPVMNPFTGRDLNPAERDMIQTSFAKATKKWVDKYPNLRIKAKLEGDMNVSSIEASYRPQRPN